MTSSRMGRLVVANASVNILGQAIPLVSVVLAVPVSLQTFGAERTGVMSLAWLAVNYLARFDIGLTRGTVRFVATAIADKDDARLRRTIQSSILANAILGVLLSVVLFVAAPPVVDGFMKVSPEVRGEARASIELLALAVLPVLITAATRSALEAGQHFKVLNAVRIPVDATGYAAPLIAAALSLPITGAVGILVLSRIVGALATTGLILWKFPGVARPRSLKASEVRAIVAYGKWVLLASMIAPILIYADRLAISSRLGLADLPTYSIPLDFVARLLVIPSALVATLFPAFSHLSQRRDFGSLSSLYGKATGYLLLAIGALSLPLLGIGGDLLSIWLGPEFASSAAILLSVFAIGVIVNSIAFVPQALIDAIGRSDMTAKIQMVQLPIYVLAIWTLTAGYGLLGTAVAWLGRVVVDAMLYFWAADRLVPGSTAKLRAHALSIIVLVIGYAAAMLVVRTQPQLARVVLTACGVIVYVSLAVVVISPADRELFRGPIARAVGRGET